MPTDNPRENLICVADRAFALEQMATYSELRDALAKALRHLPVAQMAPLLPVLQRAGGELR